MKGTLKTLVYIGILVISILLATESYAQTNEKKGGLEVNPAYSDLTLKKNEVQKKIQLKYTNLSDTPANLTISIYNYGQKDKTGETIIFDKDDLSSGNSLSEYISISPPNISLLPHEAGVVEVTISNGKDLSPGGHYGAIVARVEQEVNTQNVPIVAPSITSLLLLKKEGGELYDMRVNGVEGALSTFVFSYPQLFNLSFENKGNVHLILYGTAEIKDLFGRQLYKGVVNSSSLIVYPKNTRSLPLQLNPVKISFPLSINTLTVDGTDSLHKIKYHYQKKFAYVNVLFILGAVVFGYICWFKIIRKRKNS